MLYVYSTLSSDVNYTNYAQGGGDLPIELPGILIKGGAGVANDRLVTPRGVATPVTDEQLEQLRANEVFKLHEKNGFVQVSQSKIDPDVAAADMTGRDQSAPIVPQDLADDLQPASVGGESPDDDAAPARRGRPRKS
jgi:hypothetical protein